VELKHTAEGLATKEILQGSFPKKLCMAKVVRVCQEFTTVGLFDTDMGGG